MTRRCGPLALTLVAVLATCSPEAPPEQPGAAAPVQGLPGDAPGRVFERGVVFIGSAGDSTLTVPWLFTAYTRPGGVDRRARAWLARGGTWEPFVDESWATAPTRVPWRLHPHARLRLVVGEGERLEGLMFAEGSRRLEVAIGATRADWTGSQGETFLVADGGTVLAQQRIPGLVLDLARAHRGETPAPGDWMFLISGDSVQMVLTGNEAPGADGADSYEGWGRFPDKSERPWRDVNVSWVETRAFERARRDVPVRWRVRSGDGEMQVELTQQSANIEAGAGAGPLLPVEAFFEVTGTMRVGEATYPVRGLVRHVQR
jgi:hypothetical protein